MSKSWYSSLGSLKQKREFADSWNRNRAFQININREQAVLKLQWRKDWYILFFGSFVKYQMGMFLVSVQRTNCRLSSLFTNIKCGIKFHRSRHFIRLKDLWFRDEPHYYEDLNEQMISKGLSCQMSVIVTWYLRYIVTWIFIKESVYFSYLQFLKELWSVEAYKKYFFCKFWKDPNQDRLEK